MARGWALCPNVQGQICFGLIFSVCSSNLNIEDGEETTNVLFKVIAQQIWQLDLYPTSAWRFVIMKARICCSFLLLFCLFVLKQCQMQKCNMHQFIIPNS